MNGNRIMGVILLGMVAFIVVATLFAIISYSTNVLGSFVNFITTNDFNKLKACGITPPATVEQIKSDLAGVILPFMYMGIPLILGAVVLLSFLAGAQFEKGGVASAHAAEERRHARIHAEEEAEAEERAKAKHRK